MKYLLRSMLWLAALATTTAFAADCTPEPAADGKKPSHRVHWTTRSEILSASFDVFRSERADGGFVKINDKPIPAATNSLRLRDYEYTDSTIDPCKAYFYYVEAVAQSGYRMKLSEPQQAGPKQKPAAAAAK